MLIKPLYKISYGLYIYYQYQMLAVYFLLFAVVATVVAFVLIMAADAVCGWFCAGCCPDDLEEWLDD